MPCLRTRGGFQDGIVECTRDVLGAALAAARSGPVNEIYHCSYGTRPGFADQFSSVPMAISARDDHAAPTLSKLGSHFFPPAATPVSIQPLAVKFAAAARPHAATCTAASM